MLGVNGNDLPRPGSGGYDLPANYEGFLVGQRKNRATVERSQSRLESNRTGHAVKHDVAFHPRDVGCHGRSCQDLGNHKFAWSKPAVAGFLVDRQSERDRRVRVGHPDDFCASVQRLPGKRLEVRATRRQRNDAEAFGISGDDVQRLRADGSSASEEHDVASHASIVTDGDYDESGSLLWIIEAPEVESWFAFNCQGYPTNFRTAAATLTP